MIALAKLPIRMTVQEFLNWEPGDHLRYELVDGIPRAMAPASPAHGLLQGELARLLGNHLRSRGMDCDVIVEPGIVPKLLSAHNVRVPDLAVTCSPLAANRSVLPDPVLIVEILSPSNQAETWTNVWAYTTIPSVQEILILRSDRVAAELLRRSADQAWPEQTIAISEGLLVLESLGFRVPLAELYARVPGLA